MSLFRALRALYRDARATGIPDEITHGYLRLGPEGMTPAAKRARAAEQGFEVERVYYHGSPQSGLRSIEPGRRDPGAWWTSYLNNAASYAKGPDPGLYEAYIRPGRSMRVDHNPSEYEFAPIVDGEALDVDNNVDIVRHAMRRGYDSVHFPVGNFSEAYDTRVVFRSEDARSPQATFDPARRRWRNMLAATSAGAPIGLLAALEANREQALTA